MKKLRIIWDILCVLIAFLVGMRIIPYATLNLADVDRQSGIFRNAIVMASLEAVGLVLLFWAGCFCLSSPRWRKVSRVDRIILSTLGILLLLGMLGSAITSHQYIDRIDWIDLAIFGSTFLALTGPAILFGRGHISIFEQLIKEKGRTMR